MDENKSTMDPLKARYFYLKSSIWRCCFYAVLFPFAGVPTFYYAASLVERPISDSAYFFIIVMLTMPGIWCLQFLFPRYRIDETGVAQRCLFPVWSVWTWETFAGQKLSYESMTFYGEKYWTSLYLELEDSDFEEIMNHIRTVFRPAPDEIHESLIFKPDLFPQERVELSESGVSVSNLMTRSHYNWSEIKGLERWISFQKHHDYSRLKLISPSGRISLNMEVNKHRRVTVFRYLESKGVAFIDIDPRRSPQSHAEYSARYNDAKRSWNLIFRLFIILPCAFLLFLAITRNFPNDGSLHRIESIALVAVFFLAYCGCAYLSILWEKRRFRRYADELGLSAEEAR